MLENIVNSLALLVVSVAAFAHLNNMDKSTAGCERWAFTLLAAGALGHALTYWWPWGWDNSVEIILHIGMALAAIALMRGDLRALLNRATGAWNGVDRRGAR